MNTRRCSFNTVLNKRFKIAIINPVFYGYFCSLERNYRTRIEKTNIGVSPSEEELDEEVIGNEINLFQPDIIS